MFIFEEYLKIEFDKLCREMCCLFQNTYSLVKENMNAEKLSNIIDTLGFSNSIKTLS